MPEIQPRVTTRIEVFPGSNHRSNHRGTVEIVIVAGLVTVLPM